MDECEGKVSCGDAATVGGEELAAAAPGDKSTDTGAAA